MFNIGSFGRREIYCPIDNGEHDKLNLGKATWDLNVYGNVHATIFT